jgi:hypothetical protein
MSTTSGDGHAHRLLAVGRRAHDLDAGQQPEEHLQALADDALVVGQQDADRVILHRRPPG